MHELLELGIRTQIKLERVPNNKGPPISYLPCPQGPPVCFSPLSRPKESHGIGFDPNDIRTTDSTRRSYGLMGNERDLWSD